ncbi:MAG: hypothetical protein EOP10_22415 [Proteobacteria bacterium]|nr:MAG: hypothetical protein EOP10_22415 [Pseudomonadota bacterium]
MNDSTLPRSRTVSLKTIIIAMLICCAATAGYMAYIIKAVPKTVSNSKAGIFAELSERLLHVYETDEGLSPASGFESLNRVLREKFRESPVQLRESPQWTLRSWSDATLHGRPLLLARYDRADGSGTKLLLGFVPISKRNFPRTGGFSYKDAWFFTFGKDYTAPTADAAYPKKQVAVHLEEMKRFEERGLNLVATNYGNDFYILLLSSAESKGLGRDLFLMSTIFETSPQ